jgi:hypothetical protein
VRRTFLESLAALVGAAVAIAVAVPKAEGQNRGAIIAVSEIKDGMRGYGLTVFKGTEPERFDVEVIGVLRNFRPGQELILIKTPHPRLDVTRTVRGMSGSPIYLGGRLAGAYAYSWSAFGIEPVAGVTPIAPMLTEMRRPIPSGFFAHGTGNWAKAVESGRASTAPDSGAFTRWEGAPGQYDLLAHAKQVAARYAEVDGADSGPRMLGTPLMVGGLSERSLGFARTLFAPAGLEPFAAGGGGQGVPDGDAPAHYTDGGAVGVQLVRGDISMMGLGTVTHVEGPKLCAFGHPMMTLGNAALPATIGRVHWIFASGQASSKIGEAARPLGAMVQDRPSAIVVDERAVAPTFPVSVDVIGATGAPKNQWKFEVAEERFLSGGLLASALGSTVEATVSERRDVTWRMESKVTLRGHGTVDLEDFGIAVGGTPDPDDWSRSRVVQLVGDALNNPWERAHVERISARLYVQYTRDSWRLRGAELLEREVEPGAMARVRLYLAPHEGALVVRTVEARVPRDFADREVDLEVAPGYDVTPEAASPERLADLISNSTRRTYPPRSLVLSFRLPSAGVAFRGHVANQLPPFALDALRPQSGDLAPEAIPSFDRTVAPMERYVEGRARLRLKVRSRIR